MGPGQCPPALGVPSLIGVLLPDLAPGQSFCGSTAEMLLRGVEPMLPGAL